MTTAGWIFMLTSWACILSLIIFSYSRVLQKPTPATPIKKKTFPRKKKKS